jgi:outer membrane protease
VGKKIFLLIVLPVLFLSQASAGIMESANSFTKSFKSGGGYLDVGLGTGYIWGQNQYSLDHGLSELEFPMRAYLGGGNLGLGYKDMSVNVEAWGSIVDDPTAGMHTKDKDWKNGQTYSDTKSKSDTNTVIWDANLRYNFLRYAFGQKQINQADRGADNVKIGLLLGYRYERFGYKDYGLYQTDGSGLDAESGDVLVSEYKVKYRLPYAGLAFDLENPKFGVQASAKYAICPYAEDYDNHALRKPPYHFGAKYNKNGNVFLGDINFFWKFHPGWQANIGCDAALIRIDGYTWEEEGRDPDADQSIDTKQFFYRIGVAYRF